MISENVRRNWSACFFIKLVDPTPPPTGHAVLPYIRGLTEPLTRTLRKYDIRVSNKPIKSHQYMSSVLKTQTCNRRSYLAKTIGLHNHTICFKIANHAYAWLTIIPLTLIMVLLLIKRPSVAAARTFRNRVTHAALTITRLTIIQSHFRDYMLFCWRSNRTSTCSYIRFNYRFRNM